MGGYGEGQSEDEMGLNWNPMKKNVDWGPKGLF